MKNILVLIFIGLTTFTFAQNVTDSKGRKQGEWYKTYPKSKILEYKGQFKDDKPIGTFTYYYDSGKVRAIIKHDENSNRSEAFFYHDNGNLMSHGIYHAMKKDSVWANFGPSGKLSNTETYKNDLLDGKKTVYYVPAVVTDKSRVISAVYNYSNGKLNGEAIEYFINGAVKVKGSYINDRKNGIWESYHANGKLMMLERFKNGAHHGWSYAYDETGKELGKQYFYNGKLLEGKELEKKLAELKSKGIDPNK